MPSKRRPKELLRLFAVLEPLDQWMTAAKTKYAVIGGVAAGLLGRPRVTRDLDLTIFVDDDRCAAILKQGKRLGFVGRIDDPLAFALRSRVLLLRYEPQTVDVDVALGAMPFDDEVIKRAIVTNVADRAVPIASAEDLVIMKAIARRPQDLRDIEGLMDTHPRLDMDRVRHYVTHFGELLDVPGLVDVVDDLWQTATKHHP